MSGIYKAKFQRAKEYISAHPDETKEAQAKACFVSTRLIALARVELIKEGVLPPARKTEPEPSPLAVPRKKAKRPPTVPAPRASSSTEEDVASPSVTPPPSMLDHDAMTAMADMIDELDDLDDEDVHKRLLRQCLTFAFNPKLHPDTRMSASQMWAKLRDQAKTKDLGPGIPLTFEAAVERMRDLMVAAGTQITLAAVHAAFKVEPENGTQTNEQAPPPVGTTEAPSTDGHASGATAPEGMRPIDLGDSGERTT